MKIQIKSVIANTTTNSDTAYFNLSPCLIHGIHMLPLTPATYLLRPREFVREEWDAFFTQGRANVEGMFFLLSFSFLLLLHCHPHLNPQPSHSTLMMILTMILMKKKTGGYRSILYANLALIDARASYSFFRDGIDGFWDERWIDSGASRTWCLVWAAAMAEFTKR